MKKTKITLLFMLLSFLCKHHPMYAFLFPSGTNSTGLSDANVASVVIVFGPSIVCCLWALMCRCRDSYCDDGSSNDEYLQQSKIVSVNATPPAYGAMHVTNVFEDV